MYNSAKQLQRVLTAREIRKTFIDFFTVSHEHKFVRSSPVVPFCDPTVAFVNAGMNQFKSVFLGTAQAPHKRVVNSQKCVRVGGKHNDLSVVGQDGYHHTFFEMLGNWSFGDYFKREACAMALELLRGPYNIDPARLYVTYFAGDERLGIPADTECFEIWRSLGFPVSRILPFGCTDNFWEMGATGPCGPCTEIHIDHRPELGSVEERGKLVNAGRSDLTELWNLVFIQYNRNPDGSISQLPAHHVDTGMGFERLAATLQSKSSNYDTDLFTPLFDGIQQLSKAPVYGGSFPDTSNAALLDTSYRILADHARMVTACLADGMLPDQNQKLRRVLRKALNISEHVFAHEKLLSQLVPIVVETLGEAYPGMCAKQEAVIDLINHEHDVYKNLRESSSKAFAEVLTEFPNLDDIDLMECPGFVPAYREFQVQRCKFPNNTIPGDFLYKLTDTYGLTEESFLKLAELENMNCDLDRYRAEVSLAKNKSKESQREDGGLCDVALEQRISEAQATLTKRLPATDNSHKYVYFFDSENESYRIPNVRSRVLGLLLNDAEVSRTQSSRLQDPTDTLSIVTAASNFYYESGGQQSDAGHILVSSTHKPEQPPHLLNVIRVKQLNDCVVHVCRLAAPTDDFGLAIGDEVELQVDASTRQLNTCHHTATHLLNAAIRSLFNKVTYQVSSSVSSEQCKLELGLLGKRIQKEDVQLIEDLINRIICAATPVHVELLSAGDVLQQNDITMVPGEVYPEQGLRLINVQCPEMQLSSKELCCGTHVTNTSELSCFCIVNLKQTNRARFAFTAVAGQAAENVLKTAALLRHRVDLLEQQLQPDKLTNATEVELQTIRHNMLHTDIKLPYAFKMDTLERIHDMLKRIKETSRTTLKEFVEVEMRNLLQEKPVDSHPFILHYITSSALVEEIPLQRATKLCSDRPILVVSMCDSVVKARCCVPQSSVSQQFDASTWLQSFADTFGGQVAAPKGQNPQFVCNMKGRKVSNLFEEQLEQALAKAHQYAKNYFKL
ncbi:alanine--tRNA ligase, mitochondrial [Drosophila guanche]|uniref:Alanine--tRNA ligase n=1 Tax=Drosophila guanche TaxID=7266 RepID=A0A3B0K3B0_DROGU|nr:alanine--tRNA ligase, mitochondrial [Drosophila guanche]SPP87162.1 blast:Alanine--tRNA ligase%2C mitochondrial [Drosophila guanche]